MLKVNNHHIVPKTQTFQLTNQVVINDCELTREVGFDRQITKTRFNAGIDSNDIGDGCGWCNGHAIGVTHAILGDFLAQGIPVQRH